VTMVLVQVFQKKVSGLKWAYWIKMMPLKEALKFPVAPCLLSETPIK
jgi:hypothetical protein